MVTRPFEEGLGKDLQYIPVEVAREGNLLCFSRGLVVCELALDLETRAQLTKLNRVPLDCTVFMMIKQYSSCLRICCIPKKSLDQLTTSKNLVG